MGKRFSADISLNQQEDFVNYIVTDFFGKEGFVYKQYKGEYVWQKGGALTAPQFVKFEYANGVAHIEAWLKTSILPGLYCGEMGLDGAYGFAIKDALKNRINELVSLLQQPVSQQGAAVRQANVQQPIPVAVHNPTKKATVALIMGIVSLVAWIIPIVGAIVGAIGIIYAVPGIRSTGKGKAVTGLVLSIIGLIFSLGAFVLNILFLYV